MINIYLIKLEINTSTFISLNIPTTLKMSNNRSKYYDNRTLYVTSGVAREGQLHRALRMAIKNGEENLYKEQLTKFLTDNNIDLDIDSTLSNEEQNNFVVGHLNDLEITYPEKESLECRIRVNLIVNKSGNYYGFGYIHVSKENVYWMLLGKNPDGSDRVLEYPDPNWTPPSPKEALTEEEEMERYSGMKWYEIAEEEDKYVQPVIREILPPLMEVPGYEYDEMQYRHHQDVALKDGKDPATVPTTGYFELSRAYARDVDQGKMGNVLCARQVPDWIPPVAFKNIFQDYANDNTTKHIVKGSDGDQPKYDTYPMISLIDGKKDGGKIVFITFENDTRDAIFALLMTRKQHIVHPNNSKLQCTLIFDHAYEQGKSKGRNDRYSKSDRSDRSRYQPVGDSRGRGADTRNRGRGRDVSRGRDTRGRGRDRDTRGRGRDTRDRDTRDTRSGGRDNVDVNMLSKYNYTKK